MSGARRVGHRLRGFEPRKSHPANSVFFSLSVSKTMSAPLRLSRSTLSVAHWTYASGLSGARCTAVQNRFGLFIFASLLVFEAEISNPHSVLILRLLRHFHDFLQRSHYSMRLRILSIHPNRIELENRVEVFDLGLLHNAQSAHLVKRINCSIHVCLRYRCLPSGGWANPKLISKPATWLEDSIDLFKYFTNAKRQVGQNRIDSIKSKLSSKALNDEPSLTLKDRLQRPRVSFEHLLSLLQPHRHQRLLRNTLLTAQSFGQSRTQGPRLAPSPAHARSVLLEKR